MQQQAASPARLADLLEQAKAVLLERGMASMDEYGDMLQWPVARRDGAWHKVHVYHPDWCSWSDRYWGTIHYHTGRIQGTVLLGHLEHYTYRATPDANGDRFHDGVAYKLERHTYQQPAGTAYELPAMVPHWLKPKELTLTYFVEGITPEPADLVNPASKETDDHRWTQEQADALLPELLAQIEARSAALRVSATSL